MTPEDRHNEPLWLVNLRRPDIATDTATLGATVRSILDCITPDNYASINTQLASIDETLAAPGHLVAVLSSLYTWRERLPAWSDLRDRAMQHCLKNQVKGTAAAFKGLQ